MIVGVTGHRPEKLGGYENSMVHTLIRLWFQANIRELKPDVGISGMALGADQLFVEACILEGLPFIAALPFRGQSNRWPRESRIKYEGLLDHAMDVVTVSGDDVPYWTAMQLRNEWIVDRCDPMLCIFDGTPGGTKNTMRYIDQLRRDRITLDPRSLLDQKRETGTC